MASRPTDRYETLIAVNGQTALELLRKDPDRVSFVLLDIIMPVMNGIELLQVLKVRVRVDPLVSSRLIWWGCEARKGLKAYPLPRTPGLWQQ